MTLKKIVGFILRKCKVQQSSAYAFIFRKYQQLMEKPPFVPGGHFYSPIPSLKEVEAKKEKLFEINTKNIPSVNLNEAEQLQNFELLKKHYKELPFGPYKTGETRYYYENSYLSYADGIILYSMIREFKPRKIIEIGSGYSSCLILDTNEIFFDNSISCTFVEPYPERFLSLVKDEDVKALNRNNLQDIPLKEFELLSENDILFIDSTHVSKINSDVNYIFFNILPALKKGVIIHFHDIFYPFEYPKAWVYQGRAWNEAYVLRAFLEYNSAFKIIFFNTFLKHFHEEMFLRDMPLFLKDGPPTGTRGGNSSIWLQKTSE